MTTSTAPWPIGRVLALVGVVLYLATGVFPYLASGLVAPVWGIALLYLGWLVGLWWTVRLFQRKAAWGLAMPLASLVFWWLVITVGESVFGWTA